MSRVAAAAFRTEAAVGERLGSYRLVRKIGQGGMGTVYLAIRADDQYQKQVAIKLISRGTESGHSIERFRRERQILASLEHPYIARLLDGGSAGLEGFPEETPYFVMEYVEGQPVHDYCKEKGLGLADRCQLFLKVCEAVAYAHQKLIVHRDLKPGNILVTADGSPKLLDFGIAKLLDVDASAQNELTAVFGPRITPDYASPEQVRGDPITTASDVYSLGAILYELLCGVRPHRFNANNLREMERVICEIDPPTLSDTAPHLRRQLQGDLDAIVAMAMRKEPDRRYLSVEQMAADLRRYSSARPVIARQGKFRYRAGKYLRRNRTAIAAGVLLAAALIGGTTAASFEAVRASREQARAESERQRALGSQARAEASQRNAELQAEEAQHQREDAELQRASAETQRHLADRRFEQVRQLAGKFLLDFHDSIAKLPGATPARKMVVQTGLQYYDTLVRDAGGNRELLEEIARGYDRLGDVQGNPYYANLGDAPGAVASYRKALSVRQNISDSSPAFLSDRIQGHTKIAQVLAVEGDLKGSERFLKEALAFGQQGPAAGSYQVRDALSKTYGAFGDLKTRMGVHEEAVEPFLKLLDLSTQLARERKNEDSAQADISLAHTKLGDVLNLVDRPKEALDHLRVALEIDRRLAATHPDNIPLTRKLYMTYNMLGRVLRSKNGQRLAEPDEAKTYFEGAVDLADKMSAADPDNRLALTDIAVARSSLGEWLLREKNPQAAVAAHRKAVAAAERLSRVSTQTSGNQDILVHTYVRLAAALTGIVQYDEALQSLGKADEYLSQAEKLNPGSRNAKRRGEIVQGEAEVHVARKLWGQAIPAYARLISIFENQRKRDPKTEVFLTAQPEQYARLAECYEAAGQRDSAIQALRTALDRFQEIESNRGLAKDEEEDRMSDIVRLSQWERQIALAPAP